jgi:hypothetical protein
MTVVTTSPSALLAIVPELSKYVVDNNLILPAAMSFDAWDSCGVWLASVHEAIDQSLTLVRFLRADWWRYGSKFGERMYQSSAIFDVNWRTVANDASELSRVNNECRMIDGATFEQVTATKGAPIDQQPELVRQAVINGWSASQTEQAASGLDEDTYKRNKSLRKMQNIYNSLDGQGRQEFDNWYKKVKRANRASP